MSQPKPLASFGAFGGVKSLKPKKAATPVPEREETPSPEPVSPPPAVVAPPPPLPERRPARDWLLTDDSPPLPTPPVEARLAATATRLVRLSPWAIDDRRANTRTVDSAAKVAKVVDLAATIAEVGLLQPPLVDREHRLICGLHRREALRLLALPSLDERVAHLAKLQGSAPAAAVRERVATLPLAGPQGASFAEVDVLVYDMSALDDPELALAIELTENEVRTNYTRAEIRHTIELLLGLGFSLARGTNPKPLIPEVMRRFNISRATASRILAEMRADEEAPPAAPTPALADAGLGAKLSGPKRSLERLRQSFATEASPLTAEARAILEQADSLLQAIEAYERAQATLPRP